MSGEETQQQSQQRAAIKVIGAARLLDIRLVESSAFTRVDAPEDAGDVEIRFKYQGEASERHEDIFCVFADIEVNAVEKDTNGDALVHVGGVFKLLYQLPEEFSCSQEEIDAFAASNGVFNAWPYFREYVHSMTCRMGLPPITLPLFRLPKVTGSEKKNVDKSVNKKERRKSA